MQRRVYAGLACAALLLLWGAHAHAQPVPPTWRPPAGCATNDLLKFNGTTWVCSGGTFPTGTGTTNLVAKWTSSSALGNSQIFDDGNHVGARATTGGATSNDLTTMEGGSSQAFYASNQGPYQIVAVRGAAGTGGPTIVLWHDRDTDISTKTAVLSGDTLGTLSWQAATDASTVNIGASIVANVTGTVSTGVIPSALIFNTAGASGNATERMRIASDGAVGIGVTPSSTMRLRIAGVAGGWDIFAENALTSQTAGTTIIEARQSGSYDTTGGGFQSIGLYGNAISTRSAGSNTLTNVGLLATASGAQSNRAVQTDSGDVFLHNVGGTTGIGVAPSSTAKVLVQGSTAQQALTVQSSNDGTYASIVPTGGTRTANNLMLQLNSSAGFDTTAGGLSNTGLSVGITSTRTAGSNIFQNFAITASSSGAVSANVAYRSNSGDNWLNVTDGTTVIGYAAGAAPTVARVAIAQAVGSAINTNPNLILSDSTTAAQGVGGLIRFMGNSTGTTSTTSGVIKTNKTRDTDNETAFSLILASRVAGQATPIESLRINDVGTVNMLLGGHAVDFSSGIGADLSDTLYTGLMRRNYALNTDALTSTGNSCVNLGVWEECEFGSTLAYTTAAQTSPRGTSDTVGQLTCTNGGTACTAGGSDFRFIMNSSQSFDTDISSETFTFSVWAKMSSGTNTAFALQIARSGDSDSSGSVTCAINSTSWTRCYVQRTFNGVSLADNSEVRAYIKPQTATAIYLYGAQIQKSTTTRPLDTYQTVGTVNGRGADNKFFLAGVPASSPSTGGDVVRGAWVQSIAVGGGYGFVPFAGGSQDPFTGINEDGEVWIKAYLSSQAFTILNTDTAQSTGARYLAYLDATGSTISGAAVGNSLTGIKIVIPSTRSTGANTVTTTGILIDAPSSTGVANIALQTDNGDIKLNAAGGTTGIGIAPNGSYQLYASTTNAAIQAGQFTLNPSATTQTQGIAFRIDGAGTYNTTGATATSYGGQIVTASTRSSGANALTNVALLLSGSGAQNNFALQTTNGDVSLNRLGGNFETLGNATLGDANADTTLIWGHEKHSGTAPTLSSCGTSPTTGTGSNDAAGIVTTGTGGTTCTITFSRTMTNEPSCSMWAQGTATQPTCTVSATAITCTTTIASTKYHYRCSEL